MTQLARQAKAASRELSKLTTAQKNQCLAAMADALERESAAIKSANALDMEMGAKLQLSSAMLDRLKLDDKRIPAGGAKLKCASTVIPPTQLPPDGSVTQTKRFAGWFAKVSTKAGPTSR